MVVHNGGEGKANGAAASAGNGAEGAADTDKRGNVPFWLLVLGGVAMIAAFAHGARERDSAPPFDGIAFDVRDESTASADPADDGYSATRPSNHAFAMLRMGGGRFVALYGPPGADATAPPVLAGLLVGDGDERGGVFSSANVHDFSLETGALRVSAQEGHFTPARFVDGETLRADIVASAAAAGPMIASDYEGRLADANGAGPATLSIDAAGRLLIAAGHCHARGSAVANAAAPVWRLQATFEAGCAHHGATLQGHAWRRGGRLYAVLPTAELKGGAVFSGDAVAPR